MYTSTSINVLVYTDIIIDYIRSGSILTKIENQHNNYICVTSKNQHNNYICVKSNF